MGKRTAKGLGSPRLRKDGRWEYRFTVNEEGIPKRVSVFAKSQKEVIDKGRKLQEQYAKGLVVKRDGRTFETFAAEWLERQTRTGKAENTLNRYRGELKLMEPLNDLKLQAIKPTHVRRLVDGLAMRVRPSKAKDSSKAKPARVGISANTRRKVVERLRVIFREALKLELIHRNPAEFIEVEAPPSEPVGRTLEPAEVKTLLEACETHPMGLLFRLLLGCGLRKGEALALTWKDVDFIGGELSVGRTWTGMGKKAHMTKGKTRKAKRVIPIPAALLARLRSKHDALLEVFPADPLQHAYLFGDLSKGRPFDTNSPNQALERICRRTGLPPIRVHDLRHTYGSLALSNGIPLEVVSERMGHANPSITLNIYRHVMEHERRGFVFDVEDMLEPKVRPQA